MPATLDDTFYPILLSCVAEPYTRADAEAYFTKLCTLADRAIRNNERYAVIVTSEVTRFSAAGRRIVADVQARYVTPERNAATLVALVPFDNPLVRGTVTALRWLSPQLVQSIQPVPSPDAALDEALRALEANGTPFRGDLQGLCRVLRLGSRTDTTRTIPRRD